ncbi:PREDICTED: uncharacterized protein LOC108565920 [Nicrophorus vespilloides]|uniref:Uncharacterized protein LOC108565920 n=1 Tax=Nicrophorus vespilloides TaxID=110193 RepID=A0ABM1N2N3_NICVS|nr:PREDICTED: uncharacterized protein LOC108565920 [Nicrophorus vespilloides]
MCFAHTAQVHVQLLKNPLPDVIPIFRPPPIVEDALSDDEIINNNVNVVIETEDLNDQENFRQVKIVPDFHVRHNADNEEERNNTNIISIREDNTRFFWYNYMFGALIVILFIVIYFIQM